MRIEKDIPMPHMPPRIEKGVQPPDRGPGIKRYHFCLDMDVGDSISVEDKDPEEKQRIYIGMTVFGRRAKRNMKFSLRGNRIWRVQ